MTFWLLRHYFSKSEIQYVLLLVQSTRKDHNTRVVRCVQKINWIIIEAEKSEFIVPESHHSMNIPISPKIALISNDQKLNGKINLTREKVVTNNKALFGVSDTYVFQDPLNPGNCKLGNIEGTTLGPILVSPL